MGSPPEDPPVDVWDLFCKYDQLYFRGALADAPFTLDWASPRMKTITSGFGCCSFGKTGKKITLYKPMLQHRPSADLKNALLHLMIHAIEFVKHGTTCLGRHGPVFRAWMDAINTCAVEDSLRPKGGYCITTTHDFSQENSCSIQGNLWKCESCEDTLLRATKLGPPSDSCCIENVSQHATCGNMLCHWHNHKMDCGGTYVVPTRRGQKMVPKGGSSSKKASRGSMPEEDHQEEIVIHQRKLRETLFVSGKHELFSMVSCNNAKSLGSCSSEKAEEDFEKAIVLSSAPSPQSKLKWKQASLASLYKVSSKKAHRQHAQDEETREPVAAAPQIILKQQPYKTNSSAKAGKQQQQDPEHAPSKPAAAPKRPRTGSKAGSSPPRKKQYACVSLWVGIYELECSSGSDEPLINKRTERRRREREAAIKAQAAAAEEEEISSRRMDVVNPPADQVMTVDQSQTPATMAIATHQVVQPHSADPPPSSNPGSSPDLIDISDDD